jgi:hypothetical protein
MDSFGDLLSATSLMSLLLSFGDQVSAQIIPQE